MNIRRHKIDPLVVLMATKPAGTLIRNAISERQRFALIRFFDNKRQSNLGLINDEHRASRSKENNAIHETHRHRGIIAELHKLGLLPCV
jgi:hypothetical protein